MSAAQPARPRPRWMKPVITTVVIVAFVGAMALSTAVRTTAEAEAADPTKFNAAEFAGEAYDKAVPFIEENAVDIVTLQTAIAADTDAAGDEYGQRESDYTAWSFPVSVTGVAGKLEGSLLPVTVQGFPADITLYIQVGPAIVGTAVRDVTGDIIFQQFVNQLAYQQVSTEMNQRVKDEVLADVDAAALAGKTVEITGAFSLSDPEVYKVTPISVEVK